MEFNEKQVGDSTIIYLKGVFLIPTLTPEGETLGERVEHLLEAGNEGVAIDLVGVPYLDRAGLGEIVWCYTIAKRRNCKFTLLNIPKRIRDHLSTAGLLELIGDDDEYRPS